ncbi:MAG: SMC-Scp complex subunit ScpB [Planctomycetota bacterium]
MSHSSEGGPPDEPDVPVAPHSANEGDGWIEPDDEASFSLEELGAAFASAMSPNDASNEDETQIPDDDAVARALTENRALSANRANESDSEGVKQFANADSVTSQAIGNDQATDPAASGVEHSDHLINGDPIEEVATPEMIVEAALFVGHPENRSLSSARLASLMRDVTPEEVDQMIDALNESYRHNGQGIRIARDDSQGLTMVVAPEVESSKLAFSGKVRETRLQQPAIEVLSLVAYQPGITASEISDRRGRDSGGLLNQLVRRRLLEVRRETAELAESTPPNQSKAKPASSRRVPRYYPAERLLVLLGLDSIADLPVVEETNL